MIRVPGVGFIQSNLKNARFNFAIDLLVVIQVELFDRDLDVIFPHPWRRYEPLYPGEAVVVLVQNCHRLPAETVDQFAKRLKTCRFVRKRTKSLEPINKLTMAGV